MLPGLSETTTAKVIFVRKWKKCQEGRLQNSNSKRMRVNPRLHHDVDDKLLLCLQRQQRLVGRSLAAKSNNSSHGGVKGDHDAIQWKELQEKCREWAIELGHADEFKASNGWLHRFLKRHCLLKQPSEDEEEEEEELEEFVEEQLLKEDSILSPPKPTTIRGLQTMLGYPNCHSWQEVGKTPEQERNDALQQVMRLEQDKQEMERNLKALEKDNEKAVAEVQRLKAGHPSEP